jgi:hypothetical protein
MRSMLIFDDLSFLRSSEYIEPTKKLTIGRTSNLLICPTKSCVGHDRTQNESERWMHEVEGCFDGRIPRLNHNEAFWGTCIKHGG